MRISRKLFVLTELVILAAIIGANGILRAAEHEVKVYQFLATFLFFLTASHWPFITGTRVSPIYVKSIDYIWLSTGVATFVFGMMSLQLNAAEKGYFEAARKAGDILNEIEMELSRVETQCIPIEMRYPGVQNIMNINDCEIAHNINGVISKFRGDEMFPLATSYPNGGGYHFNTFKTYGYIDANRDKISDFGKKIGLPLNDRMDAFERAAREGLKANKWDSSHIKTSFFYISEWWVLFFAASIALRMTKTSHEVIPEIQSYLRKRATEKNSQQGERERGGNGEGAGSQQEEPSKKAETDA